MITVCRTVCRIIHSDDRTHVHVTMLSSPVVSDDDDDDDDNTVYTVVKVCHS